MTYGFPGGLEDFLSRFVYLPDQGVGYFFAINTSSPGSGYAEIDQVLFDFATEDCRIRSRKRVFPCRTTSRVGSVSTNLSRSPDCIFGRRWLVASASILTTRGSIAVPCSRVQSNSSRSGNICSPGKTIPLQRPPSQSAPTMEGQ